MVGNPVDERFRPPDPSLGVEESNVHSKINEMTEGSTSTYSRLREKAIQVATIEADMDEFPYNGERDRNMSGKVGDIQRADNLQELVRGESQVIGAEKLQAIEATKSSLMAVEKLQAIESAKSSSMEAAQSSSDINRLEGSRQESVTGESSQGMNLNIQQGGENRGVRNIDSRKEAVMVESQKTVQEHGSRDGDPQEISQQQLQIANTNTRNPISRSTTVYPNQNSQRTGNPTELLRIQGTNQGNPIINNANCDCRVQETGRMHVEPARTQNYHNNFPKISSNFDRNINRNVADKNDTPLANSDKVAKIDQPQEPAPYTVIQTYADRLRFNQSKKDVSIRLTEPEITTKQGLPAVLYVKD
ncbi:hypothetical protein EJD97_005271, partial [Solanum chilense]